MVTRMEKYEIRECLQNGCCGQPEKANERNEKLAEALKEYEQEHGHQPHQRDFYRWLMEEV